MIIDLQALKAQIDLLSLAGQSTSLRKAASSGGGEWAGPCPFCGGSDRFRVQPHAPGGGRWLCRNCTGGKWQDALEYGKRLWPGLPFREVCTRLGGAAISPSKAPGQGVPSRRSSRNGPPAAAGAPAAGVTTASPASLSPLSGAQPAYSPPPESWQILARQAVEVCVHNLWSRAGAVALEYLRKRGLRDETLRCWELGYSPGARFGSGETALWVPRGVLLPCQVRGSIWYLKVALLPGQPVRCEGCRGDTPARRPCPNCGTVNKYRGVKGNRPAAIFGAGDLPGASLALFVEGEFDALIAWQELRDVTAVCTLGSATNRPDLAAWGAFLAPVETILAAYDADAAGQRGLAALSELSERVKPCPLPVGVKDINDFYLSGGDLWAWLKSVLMELDQGG